MKYDFLKPLIPVKLIDHMPKLDDEVWYYSTKEKRFFQGIYEEIDWEDGDENTLQVRDIETVCAAVIFYEPSEFKDLIWLRQ